MDERRENKWTPGAIAMLIVIPLSLLAFGIDAIVLLRDDDAYRAAHEKHAPTVTAPAPATEAPDAAPSASSTR